MAITMRHQFIGPLGGGIQAHRMIDRVVSRKWLLGIGPVDAGTAGIHEVPGLLRTATLHDVDEGGQICTHIGVRIEQGIAHPRLRRQMQYAVKMMLRKHTL